MWLCRAIKDSSVQCLILFIPKATMDHPTSPSPIDQLAKRQCLVSYDQEDENKLQIHPRQSSNGTSYPLR
ncbi:unnamed protein product [Penicillium nalgiovense]|nr:unnamed protein product [Penicillium nalgiovense]